MTKKYFTRLLQASLMCCLAVLFTACDDMFASEDNPTPAYLSMNTAPVTIKAGDTYKRTAISVKTAVVEYTSSNTNVATVNNEGVVTAIADGTTTITATVTGYSSQTGKKIFLTDSKSYKVTVLPSLSSPLTLQVLTPGTIVVNKPQPGMQYTLNGGAKTAVPDGTAINGGDLSVGDKVSFYGDGTNITTYWDGTNYTTIKGGTAEVKVYGNIMSLVDEENFATNKTLTANSTFVCLFEDYTTLKDASDLLLPATTLTANCYNGMFLGCTSLTTAPAVLPAMTTASQCYTGMFMNCTSLTAAPELPATDLTGASNCYYQMFMNCTSLTTAPAELPAMTTVHQCYVSMFMNCTSLTTAPKLPATTLGYACYYQMFRGCTSLTATPKLPATTLATGCYNNMFNGCTSLTNAYVKVAYTTSGSACNGMFDGCTNAATLHTTAANQGSWNNKMGSGKTWSTWTTASDWTD